MDQVSINPTKLSVLSIPRDKYWLFKSAILEFLHLLSKETETDQIEDSESDSDDFKDSDYIFSKKSSSVDSSSHNSYRKHKTHGSVSSSSSFHIDKEIDNKIRDKDERGSWDATASNAFNGFNGSNGGGATGNGFDNDMDENIDSNTFFHIAFTPGECTIIISSDHIQIFRQALAVSKQLRYDIQLLPQSYVGLHIDSGSNNHSRILQLTKPLSDNNISLFFLSSHFGDIVLIPHDLEDKVISILTQNKFQFNDLSGSYIKSGIDSTAPIGVDSDVVPHTPPGTPNYYDKALQAKVFSMFKSRSIHPFVDRKVSLLLTGARSSEVNTAILKTASSIAGDIVPDYFAITRTSMNEISLLLPKSNKIRSQLGFESKYLIGSTQDIINPVTIDLTKLPIDSTGIVAGLTSKIIEDLGLIDYPFELNYLSMARSAILMIPRENVGKVSNILEDL